MRRFALLFALVGCAHEAPGKDPAPAPSPTSLPGSAPIETATPAVTTPPPPAKQATHVELTSVTLADDCGGTPPWSAPVIITKAEMKAQRTETIAETKGEKDRSDDKRAAKAKMKADSADPMYGARASRRCEQTSMQLAIMAGDAASIQVKSVELFDEGGKSLGKLSPSKPTRWEDANGKYDAWDEKVAAGSTNSVSYVLSQPKWDQIGNRWNRTYTLKTVLSVGGVDQSTQKDVTLSAPTSLPPNVKT
jgi:hypothetical protein